MRDLHPLSVAGAALAALGLALCRSDWPSAGPWAALAGALLAGRGLVKNGSVAPLWAALLSALAVGLAWLERGQAWLGAGLILAALGHLGRGPLIKQLGTMGGWRLDPLLAFPGLGLAAWGAGGAGHWSAWAFVAYAAYHAYGAFMALGFNRMQWSRLQRGFAVEPGRPAPDFTLSDEAGFPVSLTAFRERSAVLLIFVRGDWCPSCHITLRTYGRHKERFQEKGITLLAIGPDPVGVNQRMVKDLGVPYKMLSDEGQRTAMAYGVQLDNATAKGILPEGIPLPASFLVDKAGVVRYTSRPEKAGEFLDPNTIFPSLQGLAA